MLHNSSLTVCILTVLALVAPASGKNKKHTDYPLAGTVTSFHSQAETGGVFDSQGGVIGTAERRVYVLKTDSGTVEITGTHGKFHDRTGTVSLTIGQKLTYRLEKTYFYTVLEDGREHRFYVLSAE